MDTGAKRNTKRTGDISELRLMHDLVRAGYLVSIPFGEDHRYDLAIEKAGKFASVQVEDRAASKRGRLVQLLLSGTWFQLLNSCRRKMGKPRNCVGQAASCSSPGTRR